MSNMPCLGQNVEIQMLKSKMPRFRAIIQILACLGIKQPVLRAKISKSGRLGQNWPVQAKSRKLESLAENTICNVKIQKLIRLGQKCMVFG